MALVTRDDEQNDPTSSDDERAEEVQEEPERADEVAKRSPVAAEQAKAAVPTGKGGFFHLNKPGQGYWTRLGTAVSLGLLILLVANFLYVSLATRTSLDMHMEGNDLKANAFPVWKVSIVGVLTIGALLLAWKYMNSPTVVDFLIATESEMKKVNWTSRKDLFGSTKVVIIFMFLIAAILFVIDVAFGYFFYLINVLKTGPFA